jgi:hypothetical protein
MGDDKPECPPKPHAFLASVRRLTAVGAIRFSFHAEEERMEEREFDTDDVIETLSQGHLKGPITPGRFDVEWKGKLVYQPFGTRRWMGVVTVVVRQKYLHVLTTEWEDWR